MDDERLYLYRVDTVVRVVDGDTYDLVVDPGFRLAYAHRFRLYGWDTPERRRGSPFERSEARRATEEAASWIADAGSRLFTRTHKADSFGRWLAELLHEGEDWSAPAGSLGVHLAALSLASPWPTRWRDRFDQ